MEAALFFEEDEMDIQIAAKMVEKHSRKILETLDYIWKHPETGYKEWKTSAYVEDIFEELGYTLHRAGDIPGFYTDIDTGRPGPKVALLAELDSVICHSHPASDPETGAVHACGHCAQMAGLVGLAAALTEPGALEGLCGSLRLMAVPAEELIEIGYRDALRKKGIIHYYGGKVEFLYRGYFDDVDMAMMIHTTNRSDCDFVLIPGGNGCVLKNITYTGIAAHAGGSPHLGINALYAANLGMQAVNALRETFRETDYIRFHPIITEGGQMVNAIPDHVTLESYVRGASLEAIERENQKINRALAAGAAALGAQVLLGDRPGYAPLNNDPMLTAICREVMSDLAGADRVRYIDEWDTGCTDMGDISSVMPALHAYASGAVGKGHGNNYYIEDPEKAVINSSKCLLLMAHALLEDEASGARRVLEQAHPIFPSKEAYFAAMDALFMDQEGVTYTGEGTARLQWVKEKSACSAL